MKLRVVTYNVHKCRGMDGRTSIQRIVDVLREVSPDKLLAYVDLLAFPRHYIAEKQANIHARDLLMRLLAGFGYADAGV